MRKLPKGQVFSLKEAIGTRPNQTLSKTLSQAPDHTSLLFSLAKGTDISQEDYDHSSLFIGIQGQVEIGGQDLGPGQVLLEGPGRRGALAKEDSVYIEIILN